MRTAGFMSMLHIYSGLGGPMPISPWVLLNSILGRDEACQINTQLWKRLDDDLYARMRPWLEYDGSSPLPVHDPRLAALMEAAINDVCASLLNAHLSPDPWRRSPLWPLTTSQARTRSPLSSVRSSHQPRLALPTSPPSWTSRLSLRAWKSLCPQAGLSAR